MKIASGMNQKLLQVKRGKQKQSKKKKKRKGDFEVRVYEKARPGEGGDVGTEVLKKSWKTYGKGKKCEKFLNENFTYTCRQNESLLFIFSFELLILDWLVIADINLFNKFLRIFFFFLSKKF